MVIPKVYLAHSGPEFSLFVEGFWRLSDWNYSNKQIIELIEGCLELGITTFDHADIYGGYTCEELFGDAIAESSIKRDQYQLVSKCGIKLISPNRPQHQVKSYDTGKQHIIQSAERSLKNLRTDYIDLLLIHRPDPLMDADEVAEAFTQLHDSGKVLHFGVSNFVPSQYELLASRLKMPLVTNQIEYSVLNMATQDDGSIDLCQKLSIRPMAWSPFAGGRLFTEQSAQAERVRSVLETMGNEFDDSTIDQIALAFILRHPAGFLPVLGTGKLERIQSAVKALDIELSREQWFTIWEASKGHGVP